MTIEQTIGVIGLGVMGGAIARRLIECGRRLVLFDTNAERLSGLVSERVSAAADIADLADRADIIITSLNTAEIVRAVVLGPGGVSSVGGPAKLLIDMSSTDPQATMAMAAQLRADCGMGWVDAPLSGGAPAALAGTLTLMLGGADQDVQRAKGVLSDLASNMTHMGANGAGQTTKLINQVLCACGFMAVAEATRLALDGGMDPQKIPAALSGGRADSRILQEFMGKMARYDLSPTGRIDNMLKDLEATQRFAMNLRTPMPLTNLIADLHRMLVAGGHGAEDSVAYMSLFDMGRAAQNQEPST